MKKKPILFLILKIVGLVGIVLFIIGIIKLITGFGNFEDNSYLIGMFLMPLGVFLGVSGLVFGFRPEITKHSIKTARYIQEENKEELSELMTTTAQINSEAVTIAAKAVHEGLGETIYCKYCGSKIDKDSEYCKYCGKKL